MEINGKKYYFFWGGAFSNWDPSYFTVDGIEFNCGEQWFMYIKAKTFGDEEIAEKILNESEPWLMKKMGREIKNFDYKVWEKVRYGLVKKGLKEKFLQSPVHKKYLLKHKDCIIVEASPEDRIWGIGYSTWDAPENINNWGENLLGKMLNEIANEIG